MSMSKHGGGGARGREGASGAVAPSGPGAPAPSAAPRHAIITGTGSAVPDRVVTNDELSAQLGTDVHDFVENTLGIVERRWCGTAERAPCRTKHRTVGPG